jgi:hypothetical protein
MGWDAPSLVVADGDAAAHPLTASSKAALASVLTKWFVAEADRITRPSHS